jgi:hypothetical protein
VLPHTVDLGTHHTTAERTIAAAAQRRARRAQLLALEQVGLGYAQAPHETRQTVKGKKTDDEKKKKKKKKV